ncbi:hypothetical protein EUGRSUZ_K00437 [Eucalyptus grandis]|uniref:Uncharacterized protein n=2 Tax=Eucalyptus grandis TaxID=71139 RepID=A0ACC3IR90_EUCGR|nr:hypothetical protein EUGRSUZ_K00437 [Eucalyptus grandis]
MLFWIAKFVIRMLSVTIFLICKYTRRHLAMDKNIEEFLQAHNNFLHISYSYSNIKKITKNFKHKLGEGGMIALGVVRGIEYLHWGCDMQLPHFDITSHNILLDKNFTLEISNFGLAKLYPTDHSIVSLTIARGTLGYMAPKFYKKHSRRKNINVNARHSSQIYFPLWVYDQVSDGTSVEMEEVVEEERKVIKKMIIVALSYIQLNPDHRPLMNKVLEMLEGDIGKLCMLPKVLIYPLDVIGPKASTKIEEEGDRYCELSYLVT